MGIVFCTTIQNSLFLFKTPKYIYTLGTFISLILNLKYSDLPGLLDHFFVNGCSRRSKKKKKRGYLRFLKKKKKKNKQTRLSFYITKSLRFLPYKPYLSY